MVAKNYPEQNVLLNLFTYKDGELFWKNPILKKSYVGRKAGGFDKGCGYERVNLFKLKFLTHRLIYIMHYGYISPEIQIDHKDNNKINNLIGNLRASTGSQNQQNTNRYKSNSTGIKGVTRHYGKGDKTWRAKISINCKEIHLGLFLTQEEAAIAYRNAAINLHKEFANYDY